MCVCMYVCMRVHVCLYIYIYIYIYICVCVCVCTRTQILACTHKHSCTYSVGVVSVRSVSKKGRIVSEITILPACPTSELLNLMADYHETLYERS